MITCPRCSFDNSEQAPVCAQCRAYLGWQRATRPAAVGRGEAAETASGSDQGLGEASRALLAASTRTPGAELPEAGVAGADPARSADGGSDVGLGPGDTTRAVADSTGAANGTEAAGLGGADGRVSEAITAAPGLDGASRRVGRPHPPLAAPTLRDDAGAPDLTPPVAARPRRRVITPLSTGEARSAVGVPTGSDTAGSGSAGTARVGRDESGTAGSGSAGTARVGRDESGTAGSGTVGSDRAGTDAGGAASQRPPRAAPPLTPAKPRFHSPQQPPLRREASATEPAIGRPTSLGAENPDDTAVLTPVFVVPSGTGSSPPLASGSPFQDTVGETVRCGYCERPSDARRHFCRCGHALPRPVATDESDQPLPAAPWYRRLRSSLPNDGFWRRMSAANNGARATFDAAQGARDRLLQVAATLGVAGLAASQLGPWGDEVRATAREQLAQLVPSPYATVGGIGVATGATADPERYWSAEHAVDGDPVTAWAAPWQPVADDGAAACGRVDQVATLDLRLPAPTDVARLTIAPGLAEVSPQRGRHARPTMVAVQLDETDCVELPLSGTSDVQSLDVSGEGVTRVVVQVVEVEAAANVAAGPELVVIREVQVQTRG